VAAKTIRKRARKSRDVTPETAANIQIADYLRAMRWRFKRNQVGVARYGKSYVRYGELGEADWTIYMPVPKIPNAFYIVHVETKSIKGRQRHEQKIWQACAEANGEFYILARSFDPIQALARAKGVIK
jgi:hypothetical protein